jgi:hypothetical protein
VDVYAYDPVSGRLASVQDALTGEVNSFVWNPEGTLARWEQSNSYARVFGYDEEGRLVKIERDYGSGGVHVAYEYGYNSNGARVWKRDVLNEQEYRYVCRIGCGGVPMRVYNRAMSGGSWASVEDYLPAGNALGYNQNWQYRHSGGELLMMTATWRAERVLSDRQQRAGGGADAARGVRVLYLFAEPLCADRGQGMFRKRRACALCSTTFSAVWMESLLPRKLHCCSSWCLLGLSDQLCWVLECYKVHRLCWCLRRCLHLCSWWTCQSSVYSVPSDDRKDVSQSYSLPYSMHRCRYWSIY